MSSRSLRGGLTLAVAALAGVVAFAWPLFIAPTTGMDAAQAPLVFALVLPMVLAVTLAELSGRNLDVKGLAMLGVLAAFGAVLRPLSTGTAGMDLVFFLLILGGRVYGAAFGFTLGALTLLASALLTGGVGPWLPYQMIAAGFVGLGAGLLPPLRGRGEIWLLCGYGLVVGFAYGWVMDFAFWPFAIGPATQFSFDPAVGPLANLATFVKFNLATSMGWNLGRALTNAALVALVGPRLLPVLHRVARRADFVDRPLKDTPLGVPGSQPVGNTHT